MVKIEKKEFYVATDGKHFFSLIEALNYDQGQQCRHGNTKKKEVTIQNTSSQGRLETRIVTICADCNNILRMN